MSAGGGSLRLWDVSKDREHPLATALTPGDVHVRLHRGELSVEDWVRPSGGGPWVQLAMSDAFVDVAAPPRRQRAELPPDEELDMTPMIDMTFLLLIFFMVTASFHLQKGFHFPPDSQLGQPQPQDKPAPGLAQIRDRLVLWVRADDSVQFDDGQGQPVGEPIPLDKLAHTLSRESQDRKVDRLLVIPDEMAAHETLIAVIDAAVQARLTDVAMADIVTGTGSPPGSNAAAAGTKAGAKAGSKAGTSSKTGTNANAGGLPSGSSPAPKILRTE
jgi:biopolymer transport protein ExbD